MIMMTKYTINQTYSEKTGNNDADDDTDDTDPVQHQVRIIHTQTHDLIQQISGRPINKEPFIYVQKTKAIQMKMLTTVGGCSA